MVALTMKICQKWKLWLILTLTGNGILWPKWWFQLQMTNFFNRMILTIFGMIFQSLNFSGFCQIRTTAQWSIICRTRILFSQLDPFSCLSWRVWNLKIISVLFTTVGYELPSMKWERFWDEDKKRGRIELETNQPPKNIYGWVGDNQSRWPQQIMDFLYVFVFNFFWFSFFSGFGAISG